MARDLSKVSTDELVDELLKIKLEELEKMEPSSKEFKDAMSSITELYKAQTDAFKLQVDNDFKSLEAENEKKKHIKDWVLGAAGIGVPVLVYIWLWFRGMRFEETGTISSNGMRRLNQEMKLLK